jgi:cytochrome c biogenesis protein CcmG, thiol:disulfide interchange protein DsbE
LSFAIAARLYIATSAQYYKDVQLRRLLPLAALVPLALAAGCDRGAHPNYTGERAPDFTVADGRTSIHLASYRGKVVLLNFWWSQCAPCIEELPSLEQLHHDDPNLAILAVSIDESQDLYSNFLVRRHVDLTTVRDPSQSAAKLFHTEMWPETYIIDRRGVIRRKIVGPQDWSSPEIRAFLQSL